MSKLAVIAGSGSEHLDQTRLIEELKVDTPFGPPSSPLRKIRCGAGEIILLLRHGHNNRIPPHEVNYRGNIWALKEAGVERIVALAAVGGISPECFPGRLVIPDQIIDYTWGRAHTFHDQAGLGVDFVDFTRPYDVQLRRRLAHSARSLSLNCLTQATYGVTQGPRLETAAEIVRLARDGCKIVGMTGMPEAALAREAGVPYACCAMVANYAAGRSGEDISMDAIRRILSSCMIDVWALVEHVLKADV